MTIIPDTQDWDTKLENSRVNVWGVIPVYRVWATREDNTFWRPRKLSELLGAGEHLGVDIELAEATGDKMGVLGAEVENQDGVEGLVRGDGITVIGRHFGV